MTNAPDTADAVTATIGSDNQADELHVCPQLDELVVSLERDPASAALIDLDPDPEQLLTQLEPIITRFDQTRFVVISDRVDQDMVFEAMHVGARHCLPKEMIGSELNRVLHRLTSNGSSNGYHRGKLITVLCSSGGCGATTIAVNLANELAIADAKPALLVDLDNHFGSVATYLGVNGEYSLADVLDYSGDIDGQLITSTALAYDDQLQVLINPVTVNPTEPAPLQLDQFDLAIDACRKAYPWTVVDAPRAPIEVNAHLGGASRKVLIVSQLRVKDIRVARSMEWALMDHGVARDRIVHVINRYARRHHTLELDDARRALGDVQIQLIRNDFKSAIESYDFGKPLAQIHGRSVLRKDIQHFAQALHSTSPSPIHLKV